MKKGVAEWRVPSTLSMRWGNIESMIGWVLLLSYRSLPTTDEKAYARRDNKRTYARTDTPTFPSLTHSRSLGGFFVYSAAKIK